MNIPFLPKILPRSDEDRQAAIEQSLVRREAEIGGTLFGPVPAGHEREFFCLDKRTWVWREAWIAKDGRRKIVTTRYETQPNGVLKLQDGQDRQRLSREEARNLYRAVNLYCQRVSAEYRRILQAA
jgi:hypothetical protein